MQIPSETLGRMAGAVSLAAFIPYLVAILRGKTTPNRATWIIWTVVGLILAWSYRSAGAVHTVWVPVSYVIGPFVILIFALRRGTDDWTRFDRNCLAAAGASVILWAATREPLIALTTNLAIDFFGALPTIKSIQEDPRREDRLAWILFLLGNAFNLAAVDRWTYAQAAYPIYMFLCSGTITFILVMPRRLR